MSCSPEILPMTRRLLADMAQLESAVFTSPRSLQTLNAEFEDEKCVTLAALCEGRLAGYAGFHYVLDEGYIDNVATAPEFRRRGIAAALMSGLDGEARKLRLSFVTLEVRSANAAAIALYRKCGYVEVGRRHGYYTLPADDALLYTKFYTDGVR